MDNKITESTWSNAAYQQLNHIRNFFIVVLISVALCMVVIHHIASAYSPALAATLGMSTESLDAIMMFLAVLTVGGAIYFVFSRFHIGNWGGVETTFFSSLAYLSLLQFEREMLREKCHQTANALREAYELDASVIKQHKEIIKFTETSAMQILDRITGLDQQSSRLIALLNAGAQEPGHQDTESNPAAITEIKSFIGQLPERFN